MSKTRTISVPSIALNYDGKMLESVGIGGELFRRETPLSAENRRLKEENGKLREFASEAFTMAFNFYHGAGTAEDLRQLKIEYHDLGIEEDE